MGGTYRANVEVQVLKVVILSGGELEQAGGVVIRSTSGRFVFRVGVYCRQLSVVPGRVDTMYSLEARRIKVVPVSTIPAVSAKIVVPP